MHERLFKIFRAVSLQSFSVFERVEYMEKEALFISAKLMEEIVILKAIMRLFLFESKALRKI